MNAKKSLIKTTTDLKGQKIRTNQNTLKTFLLRTDYISGYEVVRVQYLKICTTKQTYRQTTFFERWRAYLKRWSVISSLSLTKSERTAYCRKKNCTTIKPLKSRFVSLYIKRLRANVRNYPTSVQKRTLTKPADACRLN